MGENDNNTNSLIITMITLITRKSTNTNVYMHWKSFAPDTYKIGTLRSLVQRAYNVCSTDKSLHKELKHIRNVFNFYNGYPHYVIIIYSKNNTLN